VSEQFLDRSDVVAALKQVRREGMTEGMWGNMLVYFGKTGGFSDRSLHCRFVQMMTPRGLGFGFYEKRRGRKSVLPHPFLTRARIFACQSERHLH